MARGNLTLGLPEYGADSLPSLRASRLIRQNSAIQAQWATKAGCLRSSPFHHRSALLNALSRLNFRRAQRTS